MLNAEALAVALIVDSIEAANAHVQVFESAGSRSTNFSVRGGAILLTPSKDRSRAGETAGLG